MDEFALAVPLKFRKQLLNLAHDDASSAHHGARKTTQRLQYHYFWPKLKKTVAHHVKYCRTCQLVKPHKIAERVPLQPMVFNTHAFDIVCVDVMGGDLPRAKRGNKYVLMLCCSVSKFPFAIPLRNLRAKTIAQKMTELFCCTGIPSKLILDQMAAFKSELFAAMAEKLGIELNFSAVKHAISHGQVERTNQTIEQMLRKFLQFFKFLQYKHNWDGILPYLLFAFRNAKKINLQISPQLNLYMDIDFVICNRRRLKSELFLRCFGQDCV